MPKRDTPLPTAREPREDACAGTQTPRVLVADDDDDVRLSLRIALEDAGCEVLEAPDGVSALDTLMMSTTPLVVLLDLIMPKMSGYEVLLQVATDPHLLTRHAYCVLTAEPATSSRVGPRFAELVERYGFQVVPKPFDLDELLECITSEWRRLNGNGGTCDVNANPA